MPEIDHKTKTPEQLSAEAQERIKLASASATKPAEESAKMAPASVLPPTIANLTSEELESHILNVIAKARAARSGSNAPKEPDWSKVSELEALAPNSPIYIPVIEHDIPAYMDIKLQDQEYMPIWANQDQRRIGQLLAEGYEFIKREHMAQDFKIPLKFDSEGMYRYHDTIAMRVHKRILLGKRRAMINRSIMQLKSVDSVAAAHLRQRVIEQDPELEHGLEKGMLSFF